MKKLLAFLRSRWILTALTLLLTVVLSTGLTATIYWSMFDPKWIAFLGGVLFAAVLAIGSRASHAEWTIARRTLQLERAREQLAQEAGRSHSATEAVRLAESRMRLVADALPTLLLYVDREERCRFHNKSVESKTGLAPERIAGQSLRDVLPGAYQFVAPHVAATLSGETVEYEFAWAGAAIPETFAARHVPYPPGDPNPRGFYLLITGKAKGSAPTKPAPGVVADQTGPGATSSISILGESGETLYLHSIADELMGWDDPKAKLEHALKENQFLLFAQKILPLRNGLPYTTCYEVLLRLREEEDNLLPPGGFIPVAERYGMMEELDRWVARNVILWCRDLQRSRPSQQVPLFCVNLSEDTIRSANFARFIRYEAQELSFNPASLCFEIGEQDVINQRENVERLISTLKPLGVRFTVDSFGSVKVSFIPLKGLAFDFIKIDGSIINQILSSPTELAKARAIKTVCEKVGLYSIAEFVETKETLDKLREIGVDYVQGFGIARPEPIIKLA